VKKLTIITRQTILQDWEYEVEVDDDFPANGNWHEGLYDIIHRDSIMGRRPEHYPRLRGNSLGQICIEDEKILKVYDVKDNLEIFGEIKDQFLSRKLKE
tara:strand:+ start:155 stop:451 length:297 start_codon:yes stop_codon:yes gene_type:complete